VDLFRFCYPTWIIFPLTFFLGGGFPWMFLGIWPEYLIFWDVALLADAGRTKFVDVFISDANYNSVYLMEMHAV
jgi:hypothetical protein